MKSSQRGASIGVEIQTSFFNFLVDFFEKIDNKMTHQAWISIKFYLCDLPNTLVLMSQAVSGASEVPQSHGKLIF